MNYSDQARQIIAENIYMTLATAGLEGEPWISPVFFAHDEQYNLYWISNKDAKHSQLLSANPQVSIAIFNSTLGEGEGNCVYLACQARELTNAEEIKSAIAVYNARATQDEFKASSIAAVTGDAAWRIYKATPQQVFTLTNGKEVGGQYVDERVEINLLN